MRWFCGVALIATTGCMSSATTASRGEVEALLERRGEPALEARGRARAPNATAPARGGPSLRTGAKASSSDCNVLAASVARSHPRIRAADERARAALARSRAEGSLPPPKASFEVWDFPLTEPETADREGMYMLGLEQEFPPASAREARVRAEIEEGRVALADASVNARELGSEVAHTCVAWSIAEALRERLTAHRALLLEMRETVLTRYRAGGDVLGTLVRLEAEIASADRHVIEAEGELASARDTLRALAGGPIPPAPPALSRQREPEAADSLLARAMKRRPETAVAVAKIGAARARVDAAESDASSPAFEARATYMQAPGGRPGLGAMVSMSLPFLWGSGEHTTASAEHELFAAEAERADSERRVRAEVTRAAGRVLVLTRARAVLIEREIPAIERALAVERAALSAGKLDLVSFVERAHALSEAHVEETRLSGELAHAWVELETAVGAAPEPSRGTP
jgi:outer membrane protein TolC